MFLSVHVHTQHRHLGCRLCTIDESVAAVTVWKYIIFIVAIEVLKWDNYGYFMHHVICCSHWSMMAFSLSPRGRPCLFSPTPLRFCAISWVTPTPVMSSLICWCYVLNRTSSSSGTWYCQVHNSAGDIIHISSLHMARPTKAATVHNLVF